jgi:hypothetical protein
MGGDFIDDDYYPDTSWGGGSPQLKAVKPDLYPDPLEYHDEIPLLVYEQHGTNKQDLEQDPWPGIEDVEGADDDESEFEIKTVPSPLIKVTAEASQRISNEAARRAMKVANPGGEDGEFRY